MNGFEASQRAITNLAIQGFSLLMLIVMLAAYSAGSCGFEALLLATIAIMGSFGPVTALSNLLNSLTQTLASGERVLLLIDEEPAVQEVAGQNDVAFDSASVEHVTFSYEGGKNSGKNSVAILPTETPWRILPHQGRNIFPRLRLISDCSLAFPKERIVGIHGKSGGGKSTLLKLLMRFWDVQQGSVEASRAATSAASTRATCDGWKAT